MNIIRMRGRKYILASKVAPAKERKISCLGSLAEYEGKQSGVGARELTHKSMTELEVQGIS